MAASPLVPGMAASITMTCGARVAASAPIEGFLHRTNTLDTLGDDEPETPCKLDR